MVSRHARAICLSTAHQHETGYGRSSGSAELVCVRSPMAAIGRIAPYQESYSSLLIDGTLSASGRLHQNESAGVQAAVPEPERS